MIHIQQQPPGSIDLLMAQIPTLTVFLVVEEEGIKITSYMMILENILMNHSGLFV